MYLQPDQISQKYASKSANYLSRVEADLSRLSVYVSQLAQLSTEELDSLNLTESLTDLHVGLKNFEHACSDLSVQNGNEFGMDKPDIRKPDWSLVRRDTRQASRLVSQLSTTLEKIHSEVGDTQADQIVPADIVQTSLDLMGKLIDLASEAR